MAEDELFDIVDEDDAVVGQAGRKECHDTHLIHRSVMFFLLDGEKRVFVNRRTANKEFFPRYWSIAFGGHVRAGESYGEALCRELLEETGLEGEATELASFKYRLPEENENVKVYAVQTDSPPRLDASEIEEGTFMSVGELTEKLGRDSFLPQTEGLYRILSAHLSRLG